MSRLRIRIAQRHEHLDIQDKEFFMYFDEMATASTLRQFNPQIFFAASTEEHQALKASKRPVYIYGAGYLGRFLLRILQHNDVPVAGFVESQPRQSTVQDHPVFAPQHLDNHAEVIVASEFWKEIYAHLDTQEIPGLIHCEGRCFEQHYSRRKLARYLLMVMILAAPI